MSIRVVRLGTSADARFFEKLTGIQRPEYLWIGCADSRVPANEIVGLDPGELCCGRRVSAEST